MRLVLRFCVRFGAGVFERLSGIYKGSLCGLAKEYEDLLSMIGRRTSKPMVCVHSQCKCLCCFVPRSFWALDTKPFRDRLCLQASKVVNSTVNARLFVQSREAAALLSKPWNPEPCFV